MNHLADITICRSPLGTTFVCQYPCRRSMEQLPIGNRIWGQIQGIGSEELMKQVRHRYIAFEVNKTVPVDDNKSSIIRAILSRLRERSTTEGHLGAKFHVIQYDAARSKGIIKIVPHSAVEQMKNLLLSVDEISGGQVETRILGISGTLKAARRKYMKYHE